MFRSSANHLGTAALYTKPPSSLVLSVQWACVADWFFGPEEPFTITTRTATY